MAYFDSNWIDNHPFSLEESQRMNPNSGNSDEWEVCPKGTLKALAKRAQQQRALKRATWGIPLILIMLLAWSGWLPSPLGGNIETLTCDQVIQVLPAYASATLASTQREQVERHLKKCSLCVEKLRSLRASLSLADRSGGWIGLHPAAESKLQ